MIPIIKSVILATLCSNPAVINAKRHQKTIISLAVSSFNFIPAKTARHTKMLHKIPLKNNSCGRAATLAFETFTIKSTTGFEAEFEKTYIMASTLIQQHFQYKPLST